MSVRVDTQRHRQVYMVLSPRALSYARGGLESLLRNSVEPIDLHLITDSKEDERILTSVVAELAPPTHHRWTVTAESDPELLDREASIFAGLANLRAFRRGHPCWRKVTDPLLLSEPGEELILLDPDLYFPNPFRFEATPESGVLLMWQRPNCLLPPETVRAAIEAGVPLAHHVDIGVSHWRAPAAGSGSDLAWLDWLIGRLGGTRLPRMMHVEAIVWSALAMHEGGGYLDPTLWHCWHRSQWKRLLRRLGASGTGILRSESWHRMKCFHAGGEAKWFLSDAERRGLLKQGPEHLEEGRILPFEELTPERYGREQTTKHMLRSLGYYQLFGAG